MHRLYFRGLWGDWWAMALRHHHDFLLEQYVVVFVPVHTFIPEWPCRACRPPTAYLVESRANITDEVGSRMIERGAVSCSWLPSTWYALSMVTGVDSIRLTELVWVSILRKVIAVVGVLSS